jgi:hypothetical protein
MSQLFEGSATVPSSGQELLVCRCAGRLIQINARSVLLVWQKWWRSVDEFATGKFRQKGSKSLNDSALPAPALHAFTPISDQRVQMHLGLVAMLRERLD